MEISDEQGDPEKFLKGSTRYYVRLVVSNGVTNTFSFAPNQFVTTLAVDPPKVLSLNDATAVTYTTAKLSGSVERPANPAPAFNDRCRIEYVPDSQFVLTGFKTATPICLCSQSGYRPWLNPGQRRSHRAQTGRDLPLSSRRRQCRRLRHSGSAKYLHHDGDLTSRGHDLRSDLGSRDVCALLRRNQSPARPGRPEPLRSQLALRMHAEMSQFKR